MGKRQLYHERVFRAHPSSTHSWPLDLRIIAFHILRHKSGGISVTHGGQKATPK
jgi:hypothetical protein